MDEALGAMVRYALVTGGSSGIGLAISQLFARDGYGLMWVSENESQLQTATDELRSNYPNMELHTLYADLSKPENCEIVYQWANRIGKVDVLVNSAGFGTYGELHALNEQLELDMIQLNVVTTYRLTRMFSERMKEAGFGHIGNLSSNTALQPVPKMSAYAATKAFVKHFSLSLHHELKGTGVTVTTVIPPATVGTRFQQRASMQGVKTFQGMLATSVEEVADRAYRGIIRGDKIVFGGWKLQWTRPIAAILPSFLIQWLIKRELDRN
ncbi:MAG: SDR family NAD(P)-dependent oxidoreductase [Bacteroidota bacterium]